MQNTKPRFTLKTILSIVFVALLVLGTVVAMVLSRLNQDTRQQASVGTGTATITLSQPGGTVAGGSKVSVDVMFNSQGALVDGVQFEADITGNVPSDIEYIPAAVSGLTPAVQTLTQPNAAQPNRKLTVLMLTPLSNPSQPFTTRGTAVKMGTLTYTAPVTGTMQVAFSPTNSIAVDTTSGTDILKAPSPVTYLFAEGQLPPGAKLYFSAASPTNPQITNRNFYVDVMMDAGSNQVSAVDAKITYDPTVVNVVSVVKSPTSPFTSFPSLVASNGQITISGNVGIGATVSPVTGNGKSVARITFTPLKAITSSALNFSFAAGNRNDSNVVSYVQSGQESTDLLASVANLTFPVNLPNPTSSPTSMPSPVATPIPSSSPIVAVTPKPSMSPSATPTPKAVTIRLSVQGKKSTTQPIRPYQFGLDLRMIGAASSVSKTVQTNGANRGLTTIDSGNYSFLVKVPGYLAKKFGTAQSAVQVTSATTELDFTNYTLLGGDFNGDGVINEVDYTLHFLTKFRTADPMVDLDESGEVNNLDFALMRSNWLLTADQLP